MTDARRPMVVFVCVKNGGKSQIAAALMRHCGDQVDVLSAGTAPGSALNEEAVQAVAEAGASMGGEHPKPIDPDVLVRADLVVVLGSEAVVEPVPGMRGAIVVWETDEPSTRGIVGMPRMRLVRDDIAARVAQLHAELTRPPAAVTAARPAIRVFEPPLCCSTGVCGPDLDEALVHFTADLDHLTTCGVDIRRHNLAADPGVFAATPAVVGFLRIAGSEGLPLVLVDGVTVAAGRYPSRSELLRYAEVPATDLGLTPVAGEPCCAPTDSTGCC